MINCGTSSIKIFKKEPQNILRSADSESGELKISNPAKFECKRFNISMSAPANIVNILASLRFLLNHLENFESDFAFSFVIIRNANIVFDAIGSVKNIKLFIKKIIIINFLVYIIMISTLNIFDILIFTLEYKALGNH
jgi:hypothetical protein